MFVMGWNFSTLSIIQAELIEGYTDNSKFWFMSIALHKFNLDHCQVC